MREEKTRLGAASLSLVEGGRIMGARIIFSATVSLLIIAHLQCAVSAEGMAPAPITMSAEEFSQMRGEDQRSLLVRVFQRRLEHARNLFCEVDLKIECYKNAGGERGEFREVAMERQCRQWLLGDSYRVDSDMHIPGEEEVDSWATSGYDAEEGVSRSTMRLPNEKRGFGRIDAAQDPAIVDNRYIYWLHGSHSHREDYLFPYLLDHQDEFEIEAPVDGDKVRLTVGYQPWWASESGGKRVFLLDSEKGFLPVRGDSRWGDPSRGDMENWRVERFVVEESCLVGDVWMPTKLREEIIASPSSEVFTVYQTDVLQIEHGMVTAEDVEVAFAEGMEIVDAIQGVTYVADANGNPAGPVELVWREMQSPSHGASEAQMAASSPSIRRILVIAGSVILAALVIVFYVRRRMSTAI